MQDKDLITLLAILYSGMLHKNCPKCGIVHQIEITQTSFGTVWSSPCDDRNVLVESEGLYHFVTLGDKNENKV